MSVSGQHPFPRDTMESLLRDHDKRILRVERRPQGLMTGLVTLAAVPTLPTVIDALVAYYAMDTGLIRYNGATYTWAAWFASPTPVPP